MRTARRRRPRNDSLDEIVEGTHGASEQHRAAPQEVPFDPFDLTPVGNDEKRLPVERGNVTIEQAGNLAGVRRTDNQSQRHGTSCYPPTGTPMAGRLVCATGRQRDLAVTRMAG